MSRVAPVARNVTAIVASSRTDSFSPSTENWNVSGASTSGSGARTYSVQMAAAPSIVARKNIAAAVRRRTEALPLTTQAASNVTAPTIKAETAISGQVDQVSAGVLAMIARPIAEHVQMAKVVFVENCH